MTDTTTLAPTDAEILAPAAYRLKDDEATKHYGKDVYVYYTPNEFKTPAAFKYLEPLYTAPVALDRIARDLLFDVKNRVNALVCLPSSERRESEIRIKQDIADFLAAPPAQEERVPLTSEQQRCIAEALNVAACESYFTARPHVDCSVNRRIFEAGFSKGYGITAAQKETP